MSDDDILSEIPEAKVFWEAAYSEGHRDGYREALKKDSLGWAICFVVTTLAGFVIGWFLGSTT